MQKPKPSYSQLKADLAAANAEVRQVMDRNDRLKEEAASAYERGYKDAITVSATLAEVCRRQATLIRYYIGIISGAAPGPDAAAE